MSLLDCPVSDHAFMKWARTQIIKMSSSITRRYEMKYSSWPYKLFKLSSPQWSEVEQLDIAQSALRLDRCCLDTFTSGLRARFPTEGDLSSPASKATICSAFSALRLATDLSERQNAEINASKPSRSSARDFSNFARESLLKQSRTEHMRRGGDDPLKPAELGASLRSCTAMLSPLLNPSVILKGIVVQVLSYVTIGRQVVSKDTFEQGLRYTLSIEILVTFRVCLKFG